MTLALIVAVAENGVIGRGNRLPWHLPEDLRYFKRVTMGKPVVMGRKTYQSIGRPLPGRPNIVVTRDAGFAAEGVHLAGSLDQALDLARSLASGGEMIVIGGAELFNAVLPSADRLYLTEVHRAYEGDVFFPQLDPAVWREASREDHPGDPSYSFVVLEKG